MTTVNVNSCPLIKAKGDGVDSGVTDNTALAHIIASEMVKDIVDNAMEILLNKSNSKNCQNLEISTDDILDDKMSTKLEDDDDDNHIKTTISETTLRDKVSVVETLKRNTLENTKRLTNFVRHPKNIVTKLVANHEARASTSQENYPANREEVLGDCKQGTDILDFVDLKSDENSSKEKGECFNEAENKIKTDKKKMSFIRRLGRYFRRNSLKIEKANE